MDNNPNDIEIRNDYEWYRDIYDSLEEQFQDDAFYFNLGFVMFTARKRWLYMSELQNNNNNQT